MPNRDFLVDWPGQSLQTGTVPAKTGRMVSLLLCLAQVVFSYFVLHSSKTLLVSTSKVTHLRSLLFRQPDGVNCVVRRVYFRGHQPFWNCDLLLVYRLMRRATSLIQTYEIKILLNLPSVILVLIFVNVKTLIMLMLFSEQTRGRRTLSLRAARCPRAPRWWPLMYLVNTAKLSQNRVVQLVDYGCC